MCSSESDFSVYADIRVSYGMQNATNNFSSIFFFCTKSRGYATPPPPPLRITLRQISTHKRNQAQTITLSKCLPTAVSLSYTNIRTCILIHGLTHTHTRVGYVGVGVVAFSPLARILGRRLHDSFPACVDYFVSGDKLANISSL